MNSWLRRRPAVLVAGVLAATGLAVSACTPAAERSRTEQVGLAVANQQLNFSQEISAGFRVGVAQLSSTAPVVVGPDIVDGNAEVRLFQDEIAQNIGAASVLTLNPDVFSGPIAKAIRTGLPVVAVDNPPLPSSGVTLFIGNDNIDLGTMLADQVASRLPPNTDGDIVVGTTSPGAPVLDDRAEGMIAEFHRRLPQATILGPFDTQQDTNANLNAWQSLVQANPHALAFVGTGDADGWNLATIRERTHGRWQAGAFDLDLRSLKAVQAGQLVLVSPEHYVAGELAGHLLAAYTTRHQKLPEGWIVVPGLAVTPANIAEIMARQSSASARAAWFAPRVAAMLSDLKPSLRPFDQIR